MVNFQNLIETHLFVTHAFVFFLDVLTGPLLLPLIYLNPTQYVLQHTMQQQAAHVRRLFTLSQNVDRSLRHRFAESLDVCSFATLDGGSNQEKSTWDVQNLVVVRIDCIPTLKWLKISGKHSNCFCHIILGEMTSMTNLQGVTGHIGNSKMRRQNCISSNFRESNQFDLKKSNTSRVRSPKWRLRTKH